MPKTFRGYMVASGTTSVSNEVASMICQCLASHAFAYRCDRKNNKIVLTNPKNNVKKPVIMKKPGASRVTYLKIPVDAVRAALGLSPTEEIVQRHITFHLDPKNRQVIIEL